MYKPFPEAKILRIDLENSTTRVDTLSGELYRLYPGGSALGVYLAMQELNPRINPLSSENVLVFSVSPLTGLPISGISRMNVTAKSPLTNTIGDTQAGGFFPVHLKANGYDAIVVTGKAKQPVYLYIHGDEVQIRDAQPIWGMVTGDAEKAIREDVERSDIEIAQIGPGGENQVRYACIINMCNRANGRNGMGAVMGAKNLKAIAVVKGKAQKAHDAERFFALSKSVGQRLQENESLAGLGKYGTAGDLEGFSEEGFLPTNNWTTGFFPEGANQLTGTTLYDTLLKERDTCFSCAVRCKRVVDVPGKIDPLYGGPEYETMSTFGSYCGVTDLTEVCYANQLCNMYGLDTISCGATISFAMECFEKGILTKEDTGGLSLHFGNAEVLAPLIEAIANRTGIGQLLAEGSARAAEQLGNGAEDLTITVKNQELPAHMPQYKPAVGLIYAVNPFGADHQSSEHDPFLTMPEDSRERIRLAKLGILKGYPDNFQMDSDKVRFALDTQKFFSVLDTLCLCQFVWGPSWELYGPDDVLELCKTGIGWETSLYELMQIGERRINMMRAFNAAAGFTRDDDTLPKKVFAPLSNGPSEGAVVDREAHEEAKECYYEFAGWDPATGNPTEATLSRLSLQWIREKHDGDFAE